MRKFAVFFSIASAVLFAQSTIRPKQLPPAAKTAADLSVPRHLFNSAGALTEASGDAPRAIALRFIEHSAPALGLSPEDLTGIYVSKEYRTEANGVTHILLRQRFGGVDVYGAAYKINLDREGRILNAGGDLRKVPRAAPPTTEEGVKALRAALREVRPNVDGSYLASPIKGESITKFSRGGIANEMEGKPVWFNVGSELRGAWLFYIPAEDGKSRYATVIDVESGRLLQKTDLTQYWQSRPPARGLVFERESPQPNPTPGIRNETRPYVERTLQSFEGDPVASPKGWVDGTQTVGNNVVAGSNPIGRLQILNPVPATAPDRNFSFPLQLGPGAPNPTSFIDAVTTNLFYWVNLAHDKFYRYGFDEASGNFQQDNVGRGGIPGDPMLAYSQFGVAANSAAQRDNAFFTVNRQFEDGARPSINMFIFAGNDTNTFADGSLDAEIVVHEYTHGVSNRLVEDAYTTFHGRSMGEAWSDYFALEFTLPEGAPPDGYYATAGYAIQEFGLGIRTRPYSTSLDINPLTFDQFGTVAWYGPEVHDDGEIWMEAMWEVRSALIRQFGEREGRRRAAQIVMDGMKLSPPKPTMIDERDAMLLAERVNFKGESQNQLWEAFAKRGFGVVARATDADSIAVTASFDKPSSSGVLRFEYPNYNMGQGGTGETVRLVLYDGNNASQSVQVQLTSSSGDLENLALRKKGETFYGEITMGNDGASAKFDSFLDVIPGDSISAYYVDGNTGSGAKLIETNAPVSPPYTMTLRAPAPLFTSGTERTLFTVATGGRSLLTTSIVALPFPFRFFGKDYRIMYVYGDGHISFDVATRVLEPCNDAKSVTQVPTVAPLWMELAYGGAAQRNENVYYSAGPGSVTVRWMAETVSTGEAVNFSVVLYDDGRMMYQYGAGNNNLVNSSFLGCSATAPFIGISNGRGTFAQAVAEYEGLVSLEEAPPVVIDAPFNFSSNPVVRLESPEANGKYSGIMTIRGIAYDPNDAIARLDVLLDGVPRRLLTPTVSRTDFCGTERVRGCPTVGFQATLDLNVLGLNPGTHTLQIRATNTRGAWKNFPDQPLTVTIEAGQSRQPVGKLETPEEGASLTGATPIRGYAYAD
ncbi:MAG: M36 family metallopeptidase, partial [Bryobacteraceae bacterium]|nr:M36 family metallopeptidase [Bryobacteraceae bacterium]